MDFVYDSDLTAMNESQLYAEADSQAGQNVGTEIGNKIQGLTEEQRLAILRLLNQLMRMIGN